MSKDDHDHDDEDNIFAELSAIFGFCLVLFGIALLGSFVFAFMLEVLA
jgi:hypothetical protein